MTDSKLVGELVAAVRAAAKIPATVVITPESRLVEDLGIDSLDLVGVYLKIQDDLGVVIDEADVASLSRVIDLANYVAVHRSADAA